MARSGINKVIIVGNLGQDPEIKYTAGGAAVTTLSIATSDSWKIKIQVWIKKELSGIEWYFGED